MAFLFFCNNDGTTTQRGRAKNRRPALGSELIKNLF